VRVRWERAEYCEIRVLLILNEQYCNDLYVAASSISA